MQELLLILLDLDCNDPELIFGGIDSVKLKSSLTLFGLIAPENCLFQAVLDKFYDGKKDEKTLTLIKQFTY